ncbi:hemerythrin domain-containing protein [Legionella hackeliae]|uniref:Putative Hemerythrin HHE cation binding domain protein n=1 Tax=Legionella hackeliae TaxID=449 RepID=A0A0A8UMG6_LEGHA|nr:hemerythrin domain-containing protein [Legionella hackeliae]KTD10547.1 DNA nickase [Legionella hackeliae]CEK10050.1 putative Hemerythrin HHE cation binding domain protein [Legionella hackeliae]STX46776.1 Alr3199 protein [Legionella hackeliae]
MDIYEYLKMDHEKVNHLFKLFEKTKSQKRAKEIVAFISQELLVHAHSEQETFYRALTQHPKTNEIALHGEKEHREIEEQIQSINQSAGKHWKEKVLKLKDIVEHHVKEEEGAIFDKAKSVLSEKEALILKEKIHYLKGKFLIWLEKRVNESSADKTIKKSIPKHSENTRKSTYVKGSARPH